MLASLAKRASPPGTSDCSGSHCLTLALTSMVLIAAMRSAPPMAFTARSTRLCSRLGVAQETTRTAQDSATRTCFMDRLPGWMDQPRRTEGRLQLFLFFRRCGGAGGGAGRVLLRGGLRHYRAELGAADAPVAVAVDGDPVAVLRFGGGKLFLAQVAVVVPVQALEY